MRTRTLQYESMDVRSYGWFDNIAIRSRVITDVNNKRLRPESPCQDHKFTRVYVPLFLPDGQSTYIRINPNWTNEVYGMTKSDRNQNEAVFAKQITKAVDKSVKRWSSLNFLYELREVGALIKKIAVDTEKLRYIDWAFGVAPTLTDIKSALRQYDSVVQNARPEIMQLKSIPFHSVRRTTLSTAYDISLAAGMPFYHETNGTLASKAVGSIDMSLPWLAMVSPDLYKVLDSIGVDPSASNAYEAMPFSWLIDWFLPIGDYLSSLPTLMYPHVRFNGVISHKVIGISDLFHRDWGLNYQPIPGPGGQVATRIYDRRVINDSASSLVKWQVQGLSNPSQIALLRDIAYPTQRSLSRREKAFDALN